MKSTGGIKGSFLAACILAAAAADPAGQVNAAPTPSLGVFISPEVTTVLGTVTVDDEDVAKDDLAGGVTFAGPGAIPDTSQVEAFEILAEGAQLLSFDTAMTLPGPLVVARGDVVQWDGSSYSMYFDASAAGVPDGVAIDGVAVTGTGKLLLSFDNTVVLGAVTAQDEDVVQYDAGTWSLILDGSVKGIPEELDVDGIDYSASGHFLLSFDTSGQVGTVVFDDEDVLEYDPAGNVWQMAYDGSALHADWPASDLVAFASLTDSDSDGLADPYETNSGKFNDPLSTGTDPLNADSDGDGFNDGYEAAVGTNPNDPNSSPDSVPTLGMLGGAALVVALLVAGRRSLKRA